EIQDSIRRADSLLQKEVSSADSLDLQKAANRTDTIVLPVDTALQAIPVHIEAGAIDSLPVDSLAKPRIKTPRGATIRSAIIPGWGQAYNNRYWKIPIVYGALGTTAAVFSYNLRYYKKIRFAYTTLINKDSANFGN